MDGGHELGRVSVIVRADWDSDASVWLATSNEIDGLAVEAETFEALQEAVVAALADLIDLNGPPFEGVGADLPIHIVAERTTRVPLPPR